MDVNYQSFVVDLLRVLEPRIFNPKEIIYTELEDVLELYFIQSGLINIGYEINRKKVFRVRYGAI